MSVKMKIITYIAVISFAFFESVCSEDFLGLLQHLVNLDLKDTSVNEACKTELAAIRNGLQNREVWALKLLDASSHLAADFVWGNNISPGVPRSCDLVNRPRNVYVGPNFVPNYVPNLTQIASPFPVNYRVLHARHHSRMQFDIQIIQKTVLDFGFCMPASCKNADSEEIFKIFLNDENFLNRTLLGSGSEILQTKLLQVSDDFFRNHFVQTFLFIFCVISTLALLDIIYKTFKRVFMYRSIESVDLKQSDEAFWEKFLSCFSISENVKILFSPRKSANSINCIDGLRAISMFFFIVGHVGLFGISSITNFQQILVFAEDMWSQPLFAMHLSVDSFYVISASLLSYNFFEYVKAHEIRNKMSMFFKIFLERYLRLTPSYLVEICLVVTMAKLVKDMSPFYLMDDNEEKCGRLWWMNILYINNFMELQELCMMWSYFLATEFQLFVISLILLFVVTTWRRFGIILFGAVFIGAVAVCGYFGYTLPLALTLHAFYVTAPYLYTPFWCRLSPYFTGIFTGWFLSYKDRTMGLNKNLINAGWIVAGATLIILEFCHIKPNISPIAALFYAAFAHFAWGAAISWVIITCTTGHGGFLERFLSANFFVPFSRLSYSTYLINPIWILVVTMFNDTPMHIDFGLLPVTTIGFVVSSFLAALIFSLFFESPVLRLIKLFR